MKHSIKEWGLLLLVSTLLLAWTSLPNWQGRALEDEDHSYTGTYFDVGDYAVHLAMLRSGMQGEWAYSFRFTTEPHSPQYIRLFYIVLGQINRLLQIEPETLFHVTRWLLGYAALFALFRLLKRIFTTHQTLWIAFFLAVLGSGLGSVERIFGWGPSPITPVDLWLIDAYMLFSLAMFPHFAFTLALICTAITSGLDFQRSRQVRHLLVVIGAALLVQCVNPIAFVVADVMLAAVFVLGWWKNARPDWREAAALAVIALAQLPLLIYNYMLLNNDSIWSQFTAQNETLSPEPVYYLWGFGLFWLLAILGTARALRERDPALLAAGLWIAAAFILAYLPWAIQRRFLLGVTIPFGVLSAYAIEGILAYLSQVNVRWQRRLPAAVLLLAAFMSLTSLILSPGYALYLRSRPDEYFYPKVLDEAFVWIAQNTGTGDFFLGAEDTGRLLAQKTGRPVYLGHSMETLRYTEKLGMVRDFYLGEASSDWLSTQPVTWVIYGPYEQRLSPDFQPGPELLPAFENESIIIYRVR